MKVVIRTKTLKNGSESLYLDIYEGGKRRYEYLRLYLVPEVDENAKRMNANAMQKANEIKSKFILGIDKPIEKKKESFVTLQEWLNEYSRRLDEERTVSSATRQQTQLVKILVEEYLVSIKKKNIKAAKFGKSELCGLLLFLREYKGERVNRFSANTLMVYQQRLVAIFNAAVHNGIINQNPFDLLSKDERFAKPQSVKIGLTVEEVKQIAVTKHSNNQVRLGFLFACFTGLRLSDIRSLRWNEIIDMGAYKAIVKEQTKTKHQVAIPLCNTALLFLPEQQNDEYVFHLPKYTWLNNSLSRIVRAAGINKPISFHSSRHTFATLTQVACKNIKVVSELLGHHDVETTQRYVDVLLETKNQAISKIEISFSN